MLTLRFTERSRDLPSDVTLRLKGADNDEWRGRILCSDPERAALRKLLDVGLSDLFRLFEQEERLFSWWDYRRLGFRRNHGLRILKLVLESKLLQRLM